MGRFNQTIGKEYEIGKILQGILSFVEFICLFQCYDNSGNVLPRRICQAPIKIDEFNKLVLIMPCYQLGSVRNYPWRGSDTPILISLLKQLVFSCYIVYLKVGFLHSDLHLDNVLFTETRDEYINYSPEISVKSQGYQIVMMDFEMSFVGIQNTRDNRKLIWNDYLTTFIRLYELKTISPIGLEPILAFLNQARIELYPLNRIGDLIDLIDNLNFKNADLTIKVRSYNPNMF